MPAEPYNFFFDASTTVVTRGKLEMSNQLGKELNRINLKNFTYLFMYANLIEKEFKSQKGS